MSKSPPKSTRSIVTESVIVRDNYDGKFTYSELESMCRAKLRRVPAELQDSIRFEVELKEWWESYYATKPLRKAQLVMHWDRPETDEELAKRQLEETKRWEERHKYDLEVFNRLKKEFDQ